MCSYSGWFIPVASFLLFCTVQITPRAVAQGSCKSPTTVRVILGALR